MKAREPVEVSKYGRASWTLYHADSDNEGQRDCFFELVLKSLPLFWPLVRPLVVDVTVGPTGSDAPPFVQIESTDLPEGLHRYPAPESARIVAATLGSVEELQESLRGVQALAPPTTDAGERDLLGLRLRAAYFRIDDETKHPAELRAFHGYQELRRDWVSPLVEKDGARWITSPSNPAGLNPIDLSLRGFSLLLESYWSPWRDEGTASHRAIVDLLTSLKSIGWYEQVDE